MKEFKGIASITVEINIKADSLAEAENFFFGDCSLGHPDILLENEQDRKKIVEINVTESDWELKQVE